MTDLIFDFNFHPEGYDMYNKGTSVRSETDELLLHLSFLEEGDYALDCGANIGVMTVNYGNKVTSNGKVFSFEPVPLNYDILSSNVQKHSMTSFVLFENFSLGQTTGTETFYIRPTNMGDCRPNSTYLDENDKITVNRISLDDYFKDNHSDWQKIKFIKMDTQGCEIDILKGCKTLFEISSDKVIFMEYWPYMLSRNNQDFEWFINFLRKYDFEIRNCMLYPKPTLEQNPVISVEDLILYYEYYKNTDTHINLLLRKK